MLAGNKSNKHAILMHIKNPLLELLYEIGPDYTGINES